MATYRRMEEKLLLEIIQQNIYFLKFVGNWYEQDQIRLKVLEEILWGMEYCRKDELMQKVYLYGSMVKSEDLIARQLFLWLIDMVEKRDLEIGQRSRD